MHDRRLATSLSIRQLRMDGALIRALTNMLESGAEYQLVNIHLRDGAVIYDVQVEACQILEMSDEQKDFLESEVVVVEVIDRNGIVKHRKTLSSC